MKRLQLGTAVLLALAGNSIGLADSIGLGDRPNCPPGMPDSCIYALSSAGALAGFSTKVVISDNQVMLKSWSAQRRASRVRSNEYRVSNPVPPEIGGGCAFVTIYDILDIPTGSLDYDDNSIAPVQQFSAVDTHLPPGNPLAYRFPMQVGIDTNVIEVLQSAGSLVTDQATGFSLFGCNLLTEQFGQATSSSQSAYLRGTYDIDAENDIKNLGHVIINFGINTAAYWEFNPAYGVVPPSPPGLEPSYPGCHTGCSAIYRNPVGTWYTGSSCVRLTFINNSGVEFYSGVVSANWKGTISFVSPVEDIGTGGLPYHPVVVGVEKKYHNDFSNFAQNDSSYGDINENSLTLSGELMGDPRTSACGPGCFGSSGSATIPRYLTDSTDPGNRPGQQLERDRLTTNTVNIDLKKMAARLPGFTPKFSIKVSVVQQTVPVFAGGEDWLPDMSTPHYAGQAPAISFAGGGAGGSGCTSAFFLGGYDRTSNNPRFRPPPAPLDPRLPCNADIAGPGQSRVPDGAVTADDIIVFINMFFASDFRADISGPGQSRIPDGKFTADDIIVYFNCFFAASPPYQGDDE